MFSLAENVQNSQRSTTAAAEPSQSKPPSRTIDSILTREELIEYFQETGYNVIPVTDPPLQFNDFLQSKSEIIGADKLAQVLCRGEPDFETYVCTLCNFWGTPLEALAHLRDSEHQMKYMQKSYRQLHHKIIVARARNREALRRQTVVEIAKVEFNKKVVKRAKAVLTRETLLRCWPDFLEHMDQSWLEEDDDSDNESICDEDSASDAQDSDIEEIIDEKPNFKDMEKGLYALIFIRAQAMTEKSITPEQIKEICEHFGIAPATVFSDTVLQYAGSKIDTVDILVAIATFFEKPSLSLPELITKCGKKDIPSPIKILLDIGIENTKAAEMVRNVTMRGWNSSLNRRINEAEYYQNRQRCSNDDEEGDRPLISYSGDYI